MNTVADTARKVAIQLEVRKDGLTQRQDGRWQLKVIIHPNDMPPALSLAPMGARYMCAMVEIGDNEEPVEHKPAGKSFAQRAGILCGSQAFWLFLSESYLQRTLEASAYWPNSEVEAAAHALREICGVKSRKELVDGTPTGRNFIELERDFNLWMRGHE